MRNKGWTIVKPSLGTYDPSCLRLDESTVRPLKQGEVLIKTNFLSLDPVSRSWLKLDHPSAFLPLKVGDTMVGVALGTVQQSSTSGLAPGDLVRGIWGWELYSIANPMLLEKIEPNPDIPVEAHLSVFSHVGRAATLGMLIVGGLKSSDTVVVSAAAGTTGAIAAQIAKANGCRVIGIAGGAAKCGYLLVELKLDAAIDYKVGDVDSELADLCPDGIDLFFDNVGGPILDTVLEHIAVGARVVICGAISQYDLEDESNAYGCKNLPLLMYRQARMQGFQVPQFVDRFAEYDAILRNMFLQGKVRSRAHLIDGLERAPGALSLLLSGGNDGKLMVKVA